MAAAGEFIDIKDATKVVVKVLKGYGSLGYSRLLMSTELPENILAKSLDVLVKDHVIEQEGEGDPQYRLASRGIGALWRFS
jgi:predicted transcriptional regulator